MTPERSKELLDDLAHWTNDAVLDEPVEAEEWDDAAPLTRRELRWLLNTAHGKTCEWVPTVVNATTKWETACGSVAGPYEAHNRPCWCGGRVVVRGQKEK